MELSPILQQGFIHLIKFQSILECLPQIEKSPNGFSHHPITSLEQTTCGVRGEGQVGRTPRYGHSFLPNEYLNRVLYLMKINFGPRNSSIAIKSRVVFSFATRGDGGRRKRGGKGSSVFLSLSTTKRFLFTCLLFLFGKGSSCLAFYCSGA
ncbi:hypothetical protein CDAR_182951 [Caerostris darwini]|uniref:Uncharacterized protein n=1 Tax=Caerostris darwini TaxID=1538125 RepID=A0AAV4T5B5_9ARAC|nr:hypothetical protein CDAR_182951 [Caerostris darwini]